MKLYLICFILLLSGVAVFAQEESESPKYTVYFFLGEDCKICQYYTPHMKDLYWEFVSDSISFVGLFPNKYSSKEGLEIYTTKYDIPFEMKMEYFGTKTKQFKVTITPEVVVYDNHSEKILYKGRIDNSYYKLGRRRRVITSYELKDVLEQLRRGENVRIESAPPIGCYITFRK